MSKANTKEQEPKEQKSMAREILEMVFYLVIALLAALFIVNFVGQRTQVDGCQAGKYAYCGNTDWMKEITRWMQ